MKKTAHYILKKTILLFILLLSYSLYGQNVTISGYIDDKETGEKLVNANIYDSETLKGTISNFYGFYSLTIPAGKIKLVFSYMGYEPIELNLDLKKDTSLNISLSPSLQIEEVKVVGNKVDKVRSTQMSLSQIPVKTIKTLPVLLGEVDILKTIQLLPGVQSGSEGTSGIYVRGGGPDQNLILLDGVPVYNVNHLFGFFSVFNADAINSFQLVKGGFPARYGGRLSSVLDIKMKEGNMKEIKGEGSIGLISSKFTLEGPILKDKTSFLISGRRTYIDLLARPFIKSQSSSTAGYYFYDLNAKINHKFSDKHRLFLSMYTGEDKAYARDNEDSEENTYKYDFGLKWGNITTALRWNWRINSKLFSNTTLTYSKYKFLTEGKEYDEYKDSKAKYEYEYFSGIDDVAGKIDFDYIPNTNHYIKFGASLINHTFSPGVSTNKQSINEGNDKYSIDTTYGANDLYSTEWAAYFEDDIVLGERTKANIGLHYSGFKYRDTYYHSIQPRLSVRYMINNRLSVKGAVSKMTQYIHLLTNSVANMPTDLWLPVTKRVKPQQAWQYALGAYYSFGKDYSLSVEGFYKHMDNLIEYKEGAGFFSESTNWQDKVESGKGWAYGAEFMLEKKVGEFTGWLGYTLSWSEREFQDISFGKRFPYKYDRRHDVSIALTYKISERIDVGATWVYGTGNAMTLAMDKYQALNIGGSGMYNDGMIENIEKRNNYRMPAYHRLDLGFNVHKKKKWGEAVWRFSIYNAYNRKNPYFLYFDTNSDGEGVMKQVSLFPILPSISYSFVF